MTVGSGERREWADWISVGQISPQEFNATITGRFENDQSNVMEHLLMGTFFIDLTQYPKTGAQIS